MCTNLAILGASHCTICCWIFLWDTTPTQFLVLQCTHLLNLAAQAGICFFLCVCVALIFLGSISTALFEMLLPLTILTFTTSSGGCKPPIHQSGLLMFTTFYNHGPCLSIVLFCLLMLTILYILQHVVSIFP